MTVLYNDEQNKRVIYLGYDMKLSKTEYAIFDCIYKSGENFISAGQIIHNCYTDKKPGTGDVAAHICHINKKADNIGYRPLIISKYGVGYKITDKP